jgi:hypothetical protein
MEPEVTIPEVLEVFQEMSAAPEKLFDLMRLDRREIVWDTCKWPR